MDEPSNFTQENQTWSTWEELLLACAVHRYGTQNWPSVALNLRTRSPNLLHLSPATCQNKFNDLRRRFSLQNDALEDDVAASPIPWLDQLRQLRLDELRRDVQRSDLSIVSLQLKVEKLKQVREKSDLEDHLIKDDPVTAPGNSSPENVAGENIYVEGSGRDGDRSFDESNTTDPETQVAGDVSGVGVDGPEAEPAQAEKTSVPVEDSCNGSSDSVMKETGGVGSEKGNSGEVRESSAAEECRSTASLSRKIVEDVKPVEPGEEDQSPTVNEGVIESQPLVEFFTMLQSHKAASFLENRLHSQEAPMYSNLIREHTEFESVQTRLNAGLYSSCKSKFFRDIFLICKNAIVFFGKGSPEDKAACELQSLVSKEIARNDSNQDPSPKQEDQTPFEDETPKPPAVPLKPASESSESLLTISKLSIPLTACRKRSSIKSRVSTSSTTPDIKNEDTIVSLPDAKPPTTWKKKEESADEVEEKLPVTKKRRKDRVGSNSRNNSTKNGKSQADVSKEKYLDVNANIGSSSRAIKSDENSESVADTEKKNTTTIGKRQSAEKFLSRMKRSSPSNNKSETLKILENDSKGATEPRKNGNSKRSGLKVTEQKKNVNSKGTAEKVVDQNKTGNGRGSVEKQQASCRGSGGRRAAKVHESPSKRSVGRPSKRAAERTKAVPAKRRKT